MNRRDFLNKTASAGTLAWAGRLFSSALVSRARTSKDNFDVAVVGAGVFGSWTAHFLNRAGQRVVLLDAYGPSNDRASSGGESRIIRVGYGPNEIYTRWAQRALGFWNELFTRRATPLFHRTGVLWICKPTDRYSLQTLTVLEKVGAKFERLSHADLAGRYPQIAVDDDAFGIFEPDSGVLMARRAVQAVVEEAVQSGVEYRTAEVIPPSVSGQVATLQLRDGTSVNARTYVFACGPWLPKLFPNLLGNRIVPSRQEVFFFGIPAGDLRFSPPNLPTWINLADEYYGMPDLENRGFKIANDAHGVPVDPDTMDRIASTEGLGSARAYLARRFPGLKDAPLMESRVCQYENTSNGDFLIDRHRDFTNVWLVGGGSGHGFKHGPSLGEYAAGQILGKTPAEPRFSLATKEAIQKRNVF
jgi:sarcosine oxidase